MAEGLIHPDEVFNAARRLGDPAARGAYLDQACADDAGLRQRVEALLAAYEQTGSFLESPAAGAADLGGMGLGATTDQPALPLREQPGTRIGPYKLLEQIGEGGMGVVFVAEQTHPVRRQVALKVIKAGMDTRQVVARFEAERQALALMDHPNIARVLDAGATDSGRPYFVMELVKGVPITRYCDEHRLTPRDRLGLFVQVCQAVQHAHQKGIIHRDLKPSNVLVAQYDGKPVPKVIDFGVAKATGGRLTEHTLYTGFGAVVGTPEYMSPEQAELNQLDVDTRSDVYSLGVLLYELLTGSTPVERGRFKQAALLELLRVVREEEPPRPSTRLSTTDQLPSIAASRGLEPRKLSGVVRGELDWIVMRALEKDRARRYETANGLARDVERYLTDEPVHACPPSGAYKLRKFARRNKGALAVASLVLFFLVLTGSGIGWAARDRAAREAEVARDRDARQAQAAEQVELILAEVDRLEREQKWPEALAAARRADAAVAGGEADAATTLRVRDRLKHHEFIDRLERARMLRARWVGRTFDVAAADRAYAQAFRDYGVDVDQLAVETSVQRLKTRPQLAIPFAAALDDLIGARRLNPDVTEWTRLVAVARGIDPEPVRDRLRATWGGPSAEVKDELLRLAESIDLRAQHPVTIVRLAGSLQQANQPDAALQVLRNAQRLHPADFWLSYDLAHALEDKEDYEGAVRFYTAAVAIRPHAVAALNQLGNALKDQKKLDEAIGCYRRAIEVDPEFAYAYSNLGAVLRDQEKLPEAIACYKKAIELDPKGANAYNNLGLALHAQKKLDEAVAAFNKAIELDPKSANAHQNLGVALRDQKKLGEAVAAFNKAIEIDPKSANAYNGLGNALGEQKKLPESFSAYHKAIELDPKHAGAYYNLGLALHAQKKLPEAIAAYQKAIEFDPKFSYAYNGLGAILSDHLKEYDKAIECFRKAIELDSKNARAHNNLGVALRGQNKLDEAVAAYRKAIELDPKDSLAYRNLGLALRHQGKVDEAVAPYRKAVELDPKSVGAYINLGALFCDDLKDYDQAIECFHKGIELDPKNARGYGNLGVALLKQKKLDEAAAACRKAIELDPEFAHAYATLGDALFHKNKLDDAISAYRKAIELAPKDAGAYVNLGIALFHDLKYEEGIATYRKAIALDPKRAAGHNSLAWLLATCSNAKLRNPEQAVALAKKAVELDPAEPIYLNTLGAAYYRTGDWKSAIAALEKSMGLRQGGDSFDWFFLAMAHWQLGSENDARRWYDRAVEWMEKNAPANEELVRFRAEGAELLGIKAEKRAAESQSGGALTPRRAG